MSQPSRTPYTILGCLTIEPMSGYDVKQYLEQTVSHFWSESYGQIYPALRRLEEEGLVEGRTERGEKGQNKRVYSITEAGRRELEDWLRQPASPVQARYEHSLKLFFGHNVGPDTCLEHLERIRQQTEDDLAHYRVWEEELQEWMEREPDSRAAYSLVVLRGGVLYSRMVLEWCAESAETLRGLRQADEGRDPNSTPDSPEEDER